jgi:hypothetical protein
MANMINADHVTALDGRWVSLFSPEEVKVGIESTTRHWIRSTVAPSKYTRSYTFEIPSFGDAYLDLKSTHLYIKGHLEHNDGSALSYQERVEQIGPQNINVKKIDREKVTPINNFLHSLFHSVKLYLGTNQQEMEEPLYAYNSYMKQLWNEEYEWGNQRMTNQGWSLDLVEEEGRDVNRYDVNADRMMWTEDSKSLDMYGPLMVDFFSTNGYLMSNTPLKIQLNRTAAPFYIISDVGSKDYDFILEDIALVMNTVKPNPGLAYQLENKLENVASMYRWDQVVARQFTIAEGSMTAHIPKLFEGILPRKLCAAFVLQTAIGGDYQKNPFAFIHLNVKNINLKMNDREEMTLQPDFQNHLVKYPYDRYLNWTGMKKPMIHKTGIYEKLAPLFCFDLLEGCPEGEKCCNEMNQSGVISLSVNFNENVPDPVMLLIFAYQPKELSITKARSVIMDQAQ